MRGEDQIDIDGLRNPNRSGDDATAGPPSPRKFLSVWFQCCHAYGRMYRNASNTKYEGRCPRCGSKVQAIIGPDGTSRRMFRAQ